MTHKATYRSPELESLVTSNSGYIIYGLTDPRSGDVRYVGKSSCGLKRPRQHDSDKVLKRETNRHKANWIHQLGAQGFRYGIKVLDAVVDAGMLPELERYWIAYGRSNNWPLTNLTDGGEGLSNPSEETRARIGRHSAARMATKKYQELAIGARRGKPLPPAWRASLSAAGMGRRLSPESREQGAAKQRGQKRGPLNLTAEAREAVGRPHRGVPKSQEQRQKMSLANLAAREKMAIKYWHGEREQSLQAWERELGMSRGLIGVRMKRLGWSFEKALTTPVSPHHNKSKGA